MAAQAALTLQRIAPESAAQALAGCEVLDPRGVMTAADLADLAQRGECFELAGEGVRAVYVINVQRGVAWVDGLAGTGPVDLTAAVDGVICEQARGLRAVALQTARPGLVRKLRRLGYRVTGWVMQKEIERW